MLFLAAVQLKTTNGSLMHLSKLMLLSATLASTLMLFACGKNPDKPASDQSIIATTPVSGEASTLTENNALQRLQQTLQAHFDKAGIKTKITAIRSTEIPNIYWVTLQGFPAVMVSADGKYVFQGEVIRLGDSQIYPLSEALKAVDSKNQFAALKTQDLIVYPAQGKAKHVVYVFTDASCPYCHKFHQQLPAINAKGVEVRYVAWPRGEEFLPTMQNIWCSADRKKAFDAAVQDQPLPTANCQNPVMDQYQLGINIGVNGTPAIYNTNGEYIGGYMNADELLQQLDKRSTK